MPDHLYSDRLLQDSPYIKKKGKLSEQAVDRIILQLNRVYPQILTNKEAEQFRDPTTALRTRLSDLLTHLQRSGDRECQEFYRALWNNAINVYATLPSRDKMQIPDPAELRDNQEKIILNDRGPVFYLTCFGAAAGLATLLYYNSAEMKPDGAARKVIGFTAIGFGRHIKSILISFFEDTAVNL